MSTFASSQKDDKRIANRIFRHKVKQSIKTGYEPPLRLREVSDVYCFAGDGKNIGDLIGKELRKSCENEMKGDHSGGLLSF